MTVREFIAQEIDRLNRLIEQNIDKESNIRFKQELSQTSYLLGIFENYKINKNTVEKILELPDSDTGYSEYRIINDCESDNPGCWIELRVKEEKIRLTEGDIIIKKK